MIAETGSLTHNPFAVLSLIAAPAILTNAASVLAQSTSTRFLRAAERMRALSSRLEGESKTQAMTDLLLVQVSRVEKQAVMLLTALHAAYVAMGSFSSASLISILGAGLASSSFVIAFRVLVALSLAVGFVGAGGLVWACFNLLGATRLAMLTISEEAAVIREREQHKRRP
jgi:Protein of unknown function (DUF2721)